MLLKTVAPDILIELDPAQSWPEQGAWTYDDYLRLPNDDGLRYEIIYGVLYVQAAPIYDHQNIVVELILALGTHVKSNNLGRILTAPFEVHLGSIARPIQPDVLFVSAANALKSGDRWLEVPPDLAVEVLSRSTRRRDLSVKLDAYEQGGVREYWIVDPVARIVTVYSRAADATRYELPAVFTVNEQIRSAVLPDLELAVATLFL